MDLRLTIFLCLFVVVITSALPSEHTDEFRAKRDVVDTVKKAGSDTADALSNAGDKIVQVFKPTEKSVIDKIADGFKE